MKIQKLQHDLIVRLLISTAVLVVAVIGVYYLRVKVYQLEERYNWLKSDAMSLSRKLDSLNKRTLEFSDAVRVWESMTPGQKQLQGLQLTKAKALLETLQAQLKLNEMNISFSKPEEVSGAEESPATAPAIGAKAPLPPAQEENSIVGEIKIASSNVSITFKALSDEYAYDFIHGLQHQFPGYVHIKTLTIAQEGKMTKETIQRIADGEFPAMVAVTVDFNWQDLRYIPVVAKDQPETNGGT
jgi:hypothetical protein